MSTETCTTRDGVRTCGKPIPDSRLVVCLDHATEDALRMIGRLDLLYEKRLRIANEQVIVAREAVGAAKHHLCEAEREQRQAMIDLEKALLAPR